MSSFLFDQVLLVLLLEAAGLVALAAAVWTPAAVRYIRRRWAELDRELTEELLAMAGSRSQARRSLAPADNFSRQTRM